MKFDITHEVTPVSTFRVATIVGKFDLQTNHIQEHFAGDIEMPGEWQIGLIVGKSGSGKSSIAKNLFPDAYISGFEYSHESILDDMPEDLTTDEIVGTFNSVGFSSPTSWLKPYSVLSNGEKMRVDLARAILDKNQLFVFDEFTSVVDRQVARIGSFAMQKAIRKTTNQFIAVTCHFDVEDWLLPDWIFNTDTMSFHLSQKKNKPAQKFEIFEVEGPAEKTRYWKMFSRYHYLDSKHNNAARVFIGVVDSCIASFCSVQHFPHAVVKNIKRVHRLVVLPDYQGASIGFRMLNELGKVYMKEGFRYAITTSSPALILSLKKSDIWRCTHYGRKKPHKGLAMGSYERYTTGWEMV
jgi:GNAT superfamily N-acetyltransferase